MSVQYSAVGYECARSSFFNHHLKTGNIIINPLRSDRNFSREEPSGGCKVAPPSNDTQEQVAVPCLGMLEIKDGGH